MLRREKRMVRAAWTLLLALEFSFLVTASQISVKAQDAGSEQRTIQDSFGINATHYF